MKKLSGQFKVLRAANVSGANVILYKHPTTATVRGYHQVVTFDDKNNEVDYLTFRHIRNVNDANRFFNYILSLANRTLPCKTSQGKYYEISLI